MKFRVKREEIINAIMGDKPRICQCCGGKSEPIPEELILEGLEVKESLAKEETECYTKGYEECKRKALSFLRAMEEEL